MPSITAPTPTATVPGVPAGSTISTIKDPVTGNTYSRDTAVPGSTYAPVTSAPSSSPNSSGDTSDASPEDEVAQSYGFKDYNDAITNLTAAPTDSETDLYNQAYSAAGLDSLASTITGLQNQLASSTDTINENPWLDEADRVGRVKNLTTLANADIKNYQDEYNTKLTSVKNLVSQETADNTATSNANKAKLAALEAQAKAAATSATTATKTAATPPKTIKSASGATYQWNPATQNFDLLFSGKSTTATASGATKAAISSMDSELQTVTGPDGYINPADWTTALNAWNAQGLSTASFLSNFKKYANVADPTNNYTGLTKPK